MMVPYRLILTLPNEILKLFSLSNTVYSLHVPTEYRLVLADSTTHHHLSHIISGMTCTLPICSYN